MASDFVAQRPRSPLLPYAQLYRAEALSQLKRIDEALQAYQSPVLQQEATVQEATFGAAWCLDQLQRPAEAAAAYEKVAAAGKGRAAEAAYLAARAREQAKEYDRARQAYAKLAASEVQPPARRDEAAYREAHCAWQAKDAEGAVRGYTALLTQRAGSPLAAHGELQFNKGVSFANSLTIDNFDLAAASKDRGGSSALGGQTTIHSEIDADLTASGQIPARLNGKWRFSVRNGFYQSRDKDGQLKGKPTRFDASGSSGTVTHGLAKSGDFYLKGQDLTVTGGGWVDLNNETLDCNFTVNMKNLPEFPMRMYGSLDNSKTSIGAGKLLLNTLGGLTMGVVDVLGSVVEGTWKLFR